MANKMLIDASHPEETRVVVLRGNRVEEFDFESASKKQLRGNIYLAKVTRVEPSLQAAFVDYGGNRHGFLAFSEIHPDYYQIPVVDRQALIEEEAKAQRDEEDEDARGQRRSRRFRRGDRSNGRRVEKRRGGDETLSEAYEGDAVSSAEARLGAEAANQVAQTAVEGEEVVASAVRLADDDARDDAGEAALPLDAPGEATFDADGIVGSSLPAAAESDFAEDEAVRAPAITGFAANQESAPDQDFASPEDSASRHDFAHRDADADAYEDNEARPDNQTFIPGDEGLQDIQDNGALLNSAEARSPDRRHGDADDEGEDEEEHVEQLGGDAMEEVPTRPHRYRKQYKIQEVIKRRQVLLVQVVKEERGNKGAALTTYLSLAGRYSVLMPNTARGGGISRKITDSTDRQRLKSIAQELEVPEGMGVILRTAGAARTKAEVKRDFEYLLRMWETVRETTLQSTAPTLVYEEGSLIKRAIRDLYNKDIDEIVVAGENGYREAKEFMRLLMPSHAKNVQPYRDPQPIFAKSGVEAQLDAMFSNQVTLKSGGYLVINQTEALVAIDVNSGRSTREHNIEDTALRTNLEAVDEIARQLRLRDLAGLLVLDLIDMEESRNNRAVERRLKEALKNDRARIQVGRISHFGLLEMSRQRMRTGVLEGSTIICPHCAGAGMLRSTSSIALHVLRILEDALIKNSSYDLIVNTRSVVALYILNQKRAHLRELEKRFGVSVTIGVDDSLTGAIYYVLERGELAAGGNEMLAPSEPSRYADSAAEVLLPTKSRELVESDRLAEAESTETGQEDEAREDNFEHQEGESESEAEGRRRRRRRRRRGRGGDREGSGIAANAPQPPDDALEAIARISESQPPLVTSEVEGESASESALASPPSEDQASPAPERRRPRRGGRPRRDIEQRFAVESGGDSALELALELEAEPEAVNIAVDAEASPENRPPEQARRSRRAPRARSPRRTVSAEAIDESPAPEPSEKSSALAATDSEDRASAQERDGLTGRVAVSIASAEADLQEAESTQGGEFAAHETAAHASEPSQPTSEPSGEQDRGRPKRSGWWQRAKASFRG